jgi:hypothetical protein
MTTIASPVMDNVPTTSSAPVRASPGFSYLLSSGTLVYLFPGLSRAWTRASLLPAILVAVCNTLCGVLWTGLIVLADHIWSNVNSLETQYHSIWHVAVFRQAAAGVRSAWAAEWANVALLDRIALVVSVVLFVLGAFLLPYFVVLPFGTRPGPNKACFRHVARTVLLGSGVVHWWGAAFVGILLAYAQWHMPDFLDAMKYARSVTPLLLAFTALSFWTLAVLVLAVRHDYRGPADQPEPHDPWCDDCGYILTGVDPAGRCPECGRPIAESLGPQNRPPTPWERRPSFLNLPVILAQAAAVVRRPRTLFFSMPTLTGQAAAQRWLLGSTIVLFVLALPIVPALYIALDAEWNFALLAGSLAMGLAWAVFGLMMVGVETAGIAAFSRMRGQMVYLSTSSKVTSYSALLMIPWILLGGAQLIAYTCLTSLHQGQGIQKLFHVGLQGEQVILAVSLSLAHIGGLLWYELTVYRGLRAIQYANK